MKLTVSEVHFLSSGSVSVEVRGQTEPNSPTTTAIDNVRFRIYIPKDEVPNDLDALKAIAIKAARVPIGDDA